MSSTVTATESFSSSRPLHILSKQRKCLLEAIEEARTAEEKRLDRLDYVKSKKEEKMLEKRFEIERNKDKVRLDYLLQDYNVLKNAIASGDYDKQVNLQKELSQSLTLPSNQQQSLDRRGLPLKNRFAGLDDPIDIINWKQTIAKFDRTDRKFQGRGIKFNEYEEKKKLQLLYDKQSILKQLINVQKNETDTKQISNSNNSSRNTANTHSTKLLSPRTVVSRGSSNASWATFATKGYNNFQGNNKFSKKIPIPTLQLDRINI